MSRIKMSFAFITVVIAILIVDHVVPWNQLFQSVEAKSLSVASSSSFVNHAEGKIHSDNKILSSILASKASRSSNDNGNSGGGRSSSHSGSDASTSNSGTSMGNLAGNSPDVVGGSSSSSTSGLAAPYDGGTISSGQNSDSSTAGSITGNTGGDKPIGPSNTYNANNIPFILPFP